MHHEIYMNRCLELAVKAIGNTYPNPMVGAVIVHQGKIIGEGYHHRAGEAHAEIQAINSVANPQLLSESTIYVSLEPCAHFGKTPPCALKLKELGFKKVVIGATDSHEKVNGKGISLLREAGITVVSGVLEAKCREMNKRFFTFHEKKRPYIMLKWAVSGDGYLDRDFSPTAISNSMVGQWVHTLRAQEHAILVGTRTAFHDNPSLTVRYVSGQNPTRLLIDFDLKIPQTFRIYDKEAPTIIFNSLKQGTEGHLKFLKIERSNALDDLMKHLYHLNIQSVIVEGGAFTLQNFLNAGLWDEAFVIRAPKLQLKHGTVSPRLEQPPYKQECLRDNIIEFYRK